MKSTHDSKKVNSKLNIMFLLTHQPDPRLLRQINYLSSKNTVYLVYFKRNTQVAISVDKVKSANVLELGRISNGAYIKRIALLIKELPKIRKFLDKTRIDIVIYSNLDALLLSKSYNILYNNMRNATNIIEIADLREILFGEKLLNKVFRKFDKIVMNKSIHKLIVTSPKYYEVYYSKFFKGEVLTLENKPLESMMPSFKKRSTSNKIRIGIVGGLNRGDPTKLLLDKYKNNKDVEIRIHGKGIEEEYMIDYSNKYDNIKFMGPYQYEKDISDIYSEIDIIYSVYDTNTESLNTRVALPNKLYESMYYQLPIIVSAGTYLAERVEKLGIGYAMQCDSVKDLEAVIENFSIDRKNTSNLFETIDKNEYIGDVDFIKFEQFIYLDEIKR